MKTKILLSIFSCLATVAISQQNIDSPPTNDIQKFECERLVLNSEKNIIMCLGNVSCKTEKLEITKAEKLRYNRKTNTITVYNPQSFTFDGTICISNFPKQKSTLIYTIGEDSAFIK